MTQETKKDAWSIKYTTLLFATIFMALGATASHFITTEYVELKLAAKPAQDRAILADLGYIDNMQYAVIGN